MTHSKQDLQELPKFRMAAILFATTCGAFALCALLMVLTGEVGLKSAFFVATSGVNGLAAALCHRRSRRTR